MRDTTEDHVRTAEIYFNKKAFANKCNYLWATLWPHDVLFNAQ